MNIREILNNNARRFGGKASLIFKGEELSFLQMREEVLKLSNVLKDIGVAKGDKVAICLPNCIEYVISYLACFCLGAVVVPLDFMFKKDELISCIVHSESKVFIAKSKNDIDLNEIKNNVSCLKAILLRDETKDEEYKYFMFNYFESISKAQTDLQDIDIEDKDPAMIMYTSGTTGKPKGILLNYKHLEGSPAAMDHFVDLNEKDIKLAAIPLSHIGGFIYIQNCINFGITLILMERFNPYEFLEMITRYKVTCFHIVPPMYNAILTLKQIDKFDLSSLRWVVVFGAPSLPEILKKFHKYCPNAKFLNGWGMTETCPPNTVTPFDSENIASVGKPAPHCKIKILDNEENEVPSCEIGEIVIDGWIIMDSYYKDPEATAAVKRRNGLHTGDLGRFDEKGFLYIVGRKKEMIKVGGQIVYAPEVEAAFYKHEGVAEVAVIGMSDKLKGEVIKAFIVLKENFKDTVEDLRYFARKHLANFKVPQSIELRDSLPKNRTGKIDKEMLKNT